jgi:hypothetical protein
MLERMPTRRLVLALPMALPASAQFGKILEKLGVKSGSDDKLVAGLKEALSVGAANAIKSAGKANGYFGNQLIKILLPEKLRAIEKPMRFVGLGPQIDQFVLSMNRAAEAAAPLAGGIFLDAVKQMTFDDARRILSGSDTAATDFFKSRTLDKLTAAFRPVVQKTMQDNQVTRQYQSLMAGVGKIPFVKTEFTDIDGYVVSKSLDGLFLLIGQEEKKIRHDPAARVTALLRDVFGSR